MKNRSIPMPVRLSCQAGNALRLVSLAMAACMAFPAMAQDPPAPPPPDAGAGVANINLTPRRVIFNETKRTEAIYVFNQGTKEATVDIALVDNVMLTGGEIVPQAQAAARGGDAAVRAARLNSAKDLILATPRRLLLEPGKGKTIRLRATLPEGGSGPAEYRTHLTVTTLPDADAGITADALANSARGELSMRVQSVFGISIPLIVRTGQHTISLAIREVAVERDAGSGGQPVLQFAIARTGSSSIYGNVEVRARAGKADETIGFIRGIGIYPELDARQVRVRLSRAPRTGETLTVSFRGDEGGPGEPEATTTYRVP